MSFYLLQNVTYLKTQFISAIQGSSEVTPTNVGSADLAFRFPTFYSGSFFKW